MTDIFDRCRGIPAHEVAQREGLNIRQRGNKYWALCPFHGEKTPSLCFFPDGGWKCFGCHAGGDAVAFLAQYRGIPPIEAARMLAGEWKPEGEPSPAQKERERRKKLQAEQRHEYDRLCNLIHATNAAMTERRAAIPDPDALWNDPEFAAAFEAHTAAVTMLDNLEVMT